MWKTAIIALTLILGGALSACEEAEGSDSSPRTPIERTVAPEQVTSDPPCLSGSLCAR